MSARSIPPTRTNTCRIPVPTTPPTEAEASRSDQIVALIGAPQTTDALGRHVAASLRVTGLDSVELRFGPVFASAFPLTATSSLTFNPDAYTPR